MSNGNAARVIVVDPYHKHYGLLVPFLTQRLIEALTHMEEDPDAIIPGFMSRLWAKDPSVLLLAAVDQTGKVVGYAAANFDGAQVLILQPRLDGPTENDAIKEMMETIETWAKTKGVNYLTLVARRFDPKWTKKFGFEVAKHVLIKELDG